LPSGKQTRSELENHHAIVAGKTHERSMAMFNSYVSHYQRVSTDVVNMEREALQMKSIEIGESLRFLPTIVADKEIISNNG
jgi:hypothetical protein